MSRMRTHHLCLMGDCVVHGVHSLMGDVCATCCVCNLLCALQVIADVPCVHQVLEEFVSKMFALSFWIASVDVHGAQPHGPLRAPLHPTGSPGAPSLPWGGRTGASAARPSVSDKKSALVTSPCAQLLAFQHIQRDCISLLLHETSGPSGL